MKDIKILLIALTLIATTSVAAIERKPANDKVWDSGSFGIYLNGKRVGTEKFEIQQKSGSSFTVSEFNLQTGTFKADQKHAPGWVCSRHGKCVRGVKRDFIASLRGFYHCMNGAQPKMNLSWRYLRRNCRP